VLAVVMLVALRLALGCHFLYEGVWKITHPKKLSAWGGPAIREAGGWDAVHHETFSADPFLTQAKGPVSGFFYAMIPDINARERLRIETDAHGKKSVDSQGITDRWNRIRLDFVDYYRPAKTSDDDAAAIHNKLVKDAEKTYNQFRKQLEDYLKENVDDIDAYFGSLDRFEKDEERRQGAPYQKQHRWDRMIELRAEADKWIKDIEKQELAYTNSLYSLLELKKEREQKPQGMPSASWNPFRWERMEQINFAVTYGLTAIGICLFLGLGTTPAALGGAAFMCFVVMTQPAFPGIYPPDSPIVGHALLVNKDFIEMLALLTIAMTPVGRWGGLDFFLYRWIVDPFLSRCLCRAPKPPRDR
jgi:uncharacterized membrane protein YphA (DoxX/SURF4 family)